MPKVKISNSTLRVLAVKGFGEFIFQCLLHINT